MKLVWSAFLVNFESDKCEIFYKTYKIDLLSQNITFNYYYSVANMIEFYLFPKNPYHKFFVAQNCITKGSRNINSFLLKKIIAILRLILISTEQYLTLKVFIHRWLMMDVL